MLLYIKIRLVDCIIIVILDKTLADAGMINAKENETPYRITPEIESHLEITKCLPHYHHSDFQ